MMPGVRSDLAHAERLVRERGLAGCSLVLLEETTSTNDEARRAAREGAPSGSVFVAESQTAGRGRQGRHWVSRRGESLLFSVLFRLQTPARNLPLVALAAGLAVRDAVAHAAPKAAVKLKWPNDVLAGDRKIAGVLVESWSGSPGPAVVIAGIGINVHTRVFPDGVGARATSVALELGLDGEPPDRGAILADALDQLFRDVPVVAAHGLGTIHARIVAADALRGSAVRTDDGLTGLAEGIDEDGRLLLRDRGGEVHGLAAGEVHLGEPAAAPRSEGGAKGSDRTRRKPPAAKGA